MQMELEVFHQQLNILERKDNWNQHGQMSLLEDEIVPTKTKDVSKTKEYRLLRQ
jgi:hypothetical protein